MTYFFTTKDNKINNLLEIHFRDFDNKYNEIDLLNYCYNKNIFNNKFNLYDNNVNKGVCYKLSDEDFNNISENFYDYKEKFWNKFHFTQINYGCNKLSLKDKHYTYSK